MKYLIAIMLPTPPADTIRTLQVRYKPSRWNITVAPHITLLYQGDLLIQEDELKEWLQAVAESASTFPIILKDIQYFNRTFKTVYLTVYADQCLVNLQTALVDLIQPFLRSETSYSQQHIYHPHVTVANRLTPEEFLPVLQSLRAMKLNFSFEAAHFTLLKRGPGDDTWQEIDTFPLTHPKP